MNLKEQIAKLSPAEKIQLVEEIWNDLEPENKSDLSVVKKKFLDERLAAIERGEARFVTLEDVKAQYEKLK